MIKQTLGIGGKVRCKKTLEFQERLFLEGKEYIAQKGNPGGVFVFDENHTKTVDSGLWLSLDERDIYTNRFTDYFYTVEEVRKMKLKKLNEKKH
jgi:ribosomal 30S subunit maturation factor RimM